MRYLLLLLCVCIASCNKNNGNENPFLIAFNQDGASYRFENVKFFEDGAANTFNCWYTSRCPHTENALVFDSLCQLSYISSCFTQYRDFLIQFEYRLLVDTGSVNHTIPSHQYNIHPLAEDVRPLFAIQRLLYSESQTGLGVIITINDVNSGITYKTSNYIGAGINQDARNDFRLEEQGIVSNFPYDNPNHDASYLITAKGTFSAVLYSAQGDSIVITNGEFRLPFCE